MTVKAPLERVSILIPDLIPGTKYIFSVAAENEFGAGDLSSKSKAIEVR